ncbi:MAG TPA: choice-of-anchor I family protein [Patescibacteria group bacterium]|nr:choice-of-anchor I family protein [Patescibacteria group bacterium]
MNFSSLLNSFKKTVSLAFGAALFLSGTIVEAQQSARSMQLVGRYSTGLYNVGAAEIVAHDPQAQRLFMVSAIAAQVQILDIKNPANPVLIGNINLTSYGAGVNSVAVKNGVVAVAVESAVRETNGKVVFFTTNGQFLKEVTVGALPDMVVFTPDGRYVLTANEGEPNAAYTVDPEGTVSVINISNGVANATVQNAGFSRWNSAKDSLMAVGIRIFGPNATVAQDIEPEYITIFEDSKTAYVTLQENNAVAKVDIATATVLEIQPLGLKDHSIGLPRVQNFEFTDRPVIGTTTGGQQIKLGGFSGLFFEGIAPNGNLKFITHGDRGPNGEPTTINGITSARPFALPNYQARLTRFELNKSTGAMNVTQTIFLKRADGTTPISGLPNLQAGANNTAYTDEIPVDLFGNRLQNDPMGADLEGIAIDAAGNFWLCDEYRPAIYKFNSSGTLLKRFVPAGTAASVGQPLGTFGDEKLPAVYARRRANRGFEAIAMQGNKVYAFIQSPIDNPDNGTDATSKTSGNLRILEFDMTTETVVGEYLYPIFDWKNEVDKIGDAVSIGNGKFMVIERDSKVGSDARKYMFEMNLLGATNLLTSPPVLNGNETIENLTLSQLYAKGVRPVFKRKVLNVPSLGYTGNDKIEGLAQIDSVTYAVINDNDFGLNAAPIAGNGSISLAAEGGPIILGLIKFDIPNGLDASDRDSTSSIGKINIRNWPAFGMYMPDAITSFTTGGKTYYVTANEGDAREYSAFAEEARIGANSIILDPIAFPNAASLKNNANLGRLNTTFAGGDIDGDGDKDMLLAFGGRSFSIRDENGNLVFDSGSDFETRTAQLFPQFFNVSNSNNNFDSRSSAKGPEPEGVAIGKIGISTFAFIGLERVGGVMMYDVTNPLQPRFVDYINSRDFTKATSITVNNATVSNPAAGDLGPEGLIFISEKESPTGRAMIIVANEISGTVSFYEFQSPRFTIQPRSAYICAGRHIQLQSNAEGAGIRYQWQRDGVNIPGATSAALLIPNSNVTQSGQYRVVVSSDVEFFPQIVSDSATVVVYPITTIIDEPEDQFTAFGQTVRLSVEAITPPGATFQWYRGNQPLSESARVSGTQSNVLMIQNLQPTDTASRYFVLVNGLCGALTSRQVSISVPGVTITSQPVAKTVCEGDTAVTFSVAAQPSSGTMSISYQWRKGTVNLVNNSRINGATGPVLRIQNPTTADAGDYNVIVSLGSSSTGMPSSNAALTIRATAAIITHPVSQIICQGQSTPIFITAAGDNLTYQWQKDNQDITEATGTTFSPSATGAYRVIVRNACGEVISQTANITVQQLATITAQPQDVSLNEGGTLTLTVQAQNATSYQWMRTGNDIPGATLATYHKANVTGDDAGIYTVRAINECGSALSREVLVDIATGISETAEMNRYLLKTGEPNPFSEETRISFETPVYSPVTITLSDISGRTIATLLQGNIAGGSHSLILKTADHQLASGTYYIILTAPDVQLMRKVVVVR